MDSMRYEHPMVVRADEIDVNGHANNVAYLKWVQDAAVGHWVAAVPADQVRNWAWVVVRHEIDYRNPAFQDDALVVTTWVGEITAATTERYCEIRRPADGVLLARSRTIWCAVDATTGRPRRVDASIRSLFLA